MNKKNKSQSSAPIIRVGCVHQTTSLHGGSYRYRIRVRFGLEGGTVDIYDASVPLLGSGDDPTFAEWWEQTYWPTRVLTRRWRPSTRRWVENVYRRFLKQSIGDEKLTALTQRHLEALASTLGERLSPASVRNTLAQVCSALRFATQCGLITDVPRMPRVTCPRPRHKHRSRSVRCRRLSGPPGKKPPKGGEHD